MKSGTIPFAERNTPWRGILDLATGCYPAFIFGGSLEHTLPVFHFHEATVAGLEPYLVYLAENGYRTVTSGAIANYVRNGVHPGPRCVALCFDDAWSSLWTVAAPLLKRHGLQAITYVSPGRVSTLTGLRPTINSPEGAPPDSDASATPFVSWAELQALQGAGTIDIQAHSLGHAMICSDGCIGGFVTPGFRRHPHLYPLMDTGDGERYLTPADLGAPLYTQRSRYSDALRYDNPQAFAACVRLVRENGGADFFTRPDWETSLRRLAGSFEGRQEHPAQRDEAIFADLAAARHELNARLNTDTVRHMCFPWAIASRPAEVAAEKAGYVTAFGDRLFGLRAVRAGDPPYRLMRLKHQHIYRLPGKRRSRLGKGLACGGEARPRVCLLTGSYFPVVGGGEAHARLLSGEFRRLGVPVLVLTGHKVAASPAFEWVDGVPVHRVPPAGYPRLGKYLMLGSSFWRLIKMRRDYDVIYVCGIRTLGLVAVLAARLLGKKCVLRAESRGELSGWFIWGKPGGQMNPLLKAFFILPVMARNVVLRKADIFLSIAGVIREEYEACRVPATKIVDIPNGIDEARFSPVSPEARLVLRRKLGLPASRLFAYTGKLNRGKGLEFLVRVWKVWVARHPDCTLLLIGSGAGEFLSCETELRDYVEQNGLRDAVLFAGSVSNVQEYLQSSDFFVFASESEALPLALLEALAVGLPVLASDIGGCRAIITDGQDGLLAPVNNEAAWLAGLETLLAHPAQAEDRGRAGRATVAAKFSITQVAREHLALFTRIRSVAL